MAGPGLSTTVDATYPDTSGDAKIHQQMHDAIHAIVNKFDTANATTSGFVQIGNGSLYVARALLSTDNPAIVVNTQTGTSYTTVLADAGKLVEMNNAAANAVTIPSGIYSVGHIINFRGYGAGTTSFVAGSGMTIRSRGGLLSLAGQYAEATITFRSASEGVLTGDLA